MRVLIFSSLIILFSHSIFAQERTAAYFGISGRLDYTDGLIEDYDKGYYIFGGFEGEKGWNIKTDINNELLYDKVLEHDIFDISTRGAVTDDDGNKYICGSKFNNTTWPYIIKINSCGELIWCKLLDNIDFEDGSAKDILITNDNEIIVLVKYDSEEEINVIHLIGLNENGDILWTNPYASRNDYGLIREPYAYSIKEINNDYYISGSCYWPYPDDTTHFFLRPLFIGIDSLFNEKWILPFAPLDSVYGKAFNVIELSDSVIMGVGMRRLGGSEENSLLIFFNKDGNELGYNQISNEAIGTDISQNYILGIERINDSLYMAATSVGYNNTVFPIAELIIDTSANIHNQLIHNGTIGYSYIRKTYDNNFVFVTGIEEGKSDSDIYIYKIDENLNDVPFDPTPHNYDSLCPGGIQSSTIDLTNCLVWTNIGNAPSPKEYYASIKLIPIRAYPNPVTEGPIIFEFENTEHHKNIELKCFDNFGKAIHNQKIYRYQETAKVKINNWRKGIYIGVVYSNGLPVGQCKFVVQ